MKTPYTPDNTRSSLAVVLFLCAALSLGAVLVGLSEKPQVDTVGLTTSRLPTMSDLFEDGASITFDTTSAGDASTDGAFVDESSDLIDEDLTSAEQGNELDATISESDSADQNSLQAATAEPLPTPEVAPAVAPTTAPETAAEVDELGDEIDITASGLAPEPGEVTGVIFTRPDEDAGAVVSENYVAMEFFEDGSGTFDAVLDISYANGELEYVDLSGTLTWSLTSPQVEAVVTGIYEFDSPINADDVTSTEAELKITNLGSGSGSLCTPRCFGITFTPPQGF